jgi:hypothetical protein
VSAVIAALAVAAPPSARADEGDDPRPAQALTACASGDLARGIPMLALLYTETRDPTYVFNQGRCYQQNGKLEQAADRFREYLRVGKNEPPADIRRAQAFIKEIDDTLARRQAAERTRPQNVRRREGLRVASIALAAVSAAGIGAGALLGWKVQAKEREVMRDLRDEHGQPRVVTDPTALNRKLADGGRLETWQWVSYGVAVAALAGAATTFALSGWAFSGEGRAVALAPVVAPGGMGGVMEVRF